MTRTSQLAKQLSAIRALFVCLAMGSSIAFAADVDVAALVKFEFENVLYETSTTEPVGLVAYSGSVGPYKAPGSTASLTMPTGTSLHSGEPLEIRLVESGIGAPIAGDVPYEDFSIDIVKDAQQLLYWRADNTSEDNKQAAFRYLVKLYGPDTGTIPGEAASADGVSRAEQPGIESAGDVNRLQQMENESTESLTAIARIKVPDREEFIASVAKNVTLSQKDKQSLEHKRQVLIRRVAYAKHQLQEFAAYKNDEQNGPRDVESTIRCNYEDMPNYYGEAERERVDEALAILRTALKFAPHNQMLSNAYLDVFYDKAVAELQFIKIKKAELARYRLGLAALPSDGMFVIDKEIEILRDEVLPQYRSILSGMARLLSERGGVDVSLIDPSYSACTPLGYYLFKREQPYRNKMAAKWVDGTGNIHTVPRFDPLTSTTETNDRVIFSGYKDYVMVLTVLSDYLTDTAELARLYGMRGRDTEGSNDIANAMDLITNAQQQIYMDVKLLETMFAEYSPTPGDAAGVYAARQGLLTGFGALEGVRNFLLGTANALGFDPDFLVLIKEFPDTTAGNQFDSYDALIRWVRSTDTSVYNFAKTTYQQAVVLYDTYRANADELYNQVGDIELELADRYFEITGYDDIENVEASIREALPGSELAESRISHQALQEKAKKLGELTTRLASDLLSTTYFANVIVPNKGNIINGALTEYLDSVSPEFDTITYWSAGAAGAQALFDTISSVGSIIAGSTDTPWSGVAGGISAAVVTAAGAINAAVQTDAALFQGAAEKEIDEAQAVYNADIAKADLDIEIAQAKLEVQALRREIVGNAIESQGLQAELAQEHNNQIRLIREIDYLYQRAQECIDYYSDRYYADPIHQLRAQSSQIRADNAFRDAQKWVFFVMRALEYKWNRPFAIRSGSKNYDEGTIFKIRNFMELEDLMVAIEQFNTYNLIGFNREPFVDKLSLKYDFFGFRDDAIYSINENGTSITVDADVAFRHRLAGLINDQSGLLEIPLDTFSLNKEDGVFFAGPKYDKQGKLFSSGKYLDKIEWIKFNVVSNGTPRTITGAYTYGGTSYIRTRVPGCFDMNNDRIMADEFVQFPFKYFLTLDNGATWLQRPSQSDTVKIVVSNESGEPQDSAENPFYRNTFLKERSVAATMQLLRVSESSLDVSNVKDIEIYVRHNFVSREMPPCN